MHIPRAALFLLLALPAWASAARDIRVAFDQEKAPYLWSDSGQIKGLELDIVRAALAVPGHTISPSILPNRRISASLTLGEADAATGVQKGDAGQTVFYSDYYLTYANAAITRKSSGIALHSLGDVLNYRVATWQKAWQDLKFDQLRPQGPDTLAYTEFTSQYRQTKFFWAGRAEIDVVDRNIFIWYSRILAKEMNSSEEVVFHDVVPILSVRIAFSRQADRDDFDSGLKIARAKGEIGRIYAKYGLIDPDRR